MSWLTDMLTLKRLRSSREVVTSAVRMIEGSGSRGTVSRPFSPEAALATYRSWVFACANINANGFASVPLRLYVPASSSGRKLFGTRKVPRQRMKWLRGDMSHQPSQTVMAKAQDFGDFEEVERDHPLMVLLRNPNSFLDGYSFMNLSALWCEIVGNSYQAVIRGQVGVPTELWPMPPQWVDIKPSTTKFVEGYWFGSEERNKRFYEPEDVIHVKRPNPRNQWYGMGRVEGGWWAISQNAAKHEMDQALFDNHARPDFLLTVQGNAAKDQLDRFEAKVKEKLQGKGKAGSFIAVTGEVDLKPLAWPPKDMGTEDRIVEEICAAFGVPVSMALANDPNLASAKVGYAMWRELSTLPLCKLHEARWNAELLPMFDLGEDAFLAFDNPIPADEQFALAEKTASVGKWRTVNEVRSEEGYEPVDGGDDLYAPPGTPLDMARANAETAAMAAENTAKNPEIAASREVNGKKSIDKNCGTGAGGFQHGNDCAAGGGGSPQSSVRNPVREDPPDDAAVELLHNYVSQGRSSYVAAWKEFNHWAEGNESPAVESLYRQTQSKLSDAGIDDEVVYRGIRVESGSAIYSDIVDGRLSTGQTIEISGEVVESWSENASAAKNFAEGNHDPMDHEGNIGVVLRRVVSRSDVVASFRTQTVFDAHEAEWICRRRKTVSVKVIDIIRSDN